MLVVIWFGFVYQRGGDYDRGEKLLREVQNPYVETQHLGLNNVSFNCSSNYSLDIFAS